jgi:hypothetical protein
MEIKKINVDRKPLETEYIQSRQDFQHVLANYKKAHIPVFKQPLFYGVIGFASLAALITVSAFNINPEKNDKITTSKSETIVSNTVKPSPIFESELKPSVKPATLQIAKIEKTGSDQEKAEVISPVNSKTLLTTTESKTEKNASSLPSNFPHISGISEGAISISQLCGNDGVQMRNDLEVVSFRFQYISGGTDKIVSVAGNKIPPTICAEMTKSNLEHLVFITDIEVEGTNVLVKVPNMNLWVSNKG